MAEHDSHDEPGSAPPVPDEIPDRRSRLIVAALVVCVGMALWLYRAAEPDPNRVQFFDLWRARHMLMAGAAIWGAGLLLAAAVGRKALFTWIALTLMLGSSLVLLELPGVLGLVDYPKLFGRSVEVVGGEAVPHLDLQGETQQDLAKLLREAPAPIPYRYRTDQKGFRNPVDRDSADLYLLGDSVLVAGLVPVEETLTQRIEQALARPAMTIALIAISVQKERDLFVAADVPLDNRLVLHFVFEGNDLLDSKAYRRSDHMSDHSSNTMAEDRPSRFESSFSNQLILSLQERTSTPEVSRAAVCEIDDEPYAFVWLSNSWQDLDDELGHVTDTILELRELAESSGGRYAIVFVPAKIRVLGNLCHWPNDSPVTDYHAELNPMRESLARWAAEQRIPLLDLTDSLTDSARDGRRPWFPADTHPNSEGHRAMAEEILRWEIIRAWGAESVSHQDPR